ncbi:MAG: ABC-type nitrate/sulfonate/bicarbonate transport system periplasmic component [Limisphaerales bacterium]|nr:MAG: ABC-type nitrate/sulfonate/bicarbonate transport system periplasmic component [Limisphaerales bacterium]KAG0508051.1 MAG: ABC-type nitrate/sulfonate/bicarbonate transport system periplasmic component [Limisphaerales bacterium]TXT52050.1 MAG: ABC-type nitrate/sulfonate/bicarbonate transport system periplasmic component [Limisphaerales bacterium]
MHHNALNDPFDAAQPLVDAPHSHSHQPATAGPLAEVQRDFEARQAPAFRGMEHFHEAGHACTGRDCNHASHQADRPAASANNLLSRVVENAVMRAIFPDDMERRAFLGVVGRGTAAAVIGSMFDFGTAQSMAAEPVKNIEKKDLSVGFIPITCATPIIMAEPMGFYAKHGLNVKVRKAAGWAVVRDWAVNKEVDAAHMLSPMPLALTLGAGSPAVPFFMPAVENINGQAITLALKHKNVKGPKDMKGFRFCVPFTYSMHNYLLRYYLAEGGLHPDKDVQIRIVPPPEMVANLKADNVDGYLAPDPFNQRAVYENVGFLFKLTKELWEGHPCCAFAISKEFTEKNPNTFKALFRSIVDATHFAADPKNRKDIAKAISPTNYLNQPQIVLEQVLTGRYADGLGGIQNVPDRIGFDPFPWHSMAMWILSQMKRWKHVEGELDYAKIAQQVYLAAECDKVMAELGYKARGATSKKHIIMGREFDPAKVAEYAKSFPISNL